MVVFNNIEINPPLLNSSCAWSSDLGQLTDLYECSHTGAITTRTATARGYNEDPLMHTVRRYGSDTEAILTLSQVVFAETATSTLNSYGYSPHPLAKYLGWVEEILTAHPTSAKPVIISIMSSDSVTLAEMVASIQALRTKLEDNKAPLSRVAIELNTSCPNIPNSPPSGYTFLSLQPLLKILADAHNEDKTLTIGLKLPPYTYMGQFTDVVSGLKSFSTDIRSSVPTPTTEATKSVYKSPFAFLTCTNTLGNSLLFAEQTTTAADDATSQASAFALPTPLGGLAGDALHALALGNVFTFKQLLATQDAREHGLGKIKIIGVGGVTSAEAAARMRRAGADAVGSATLFGKEGVRAFEILSGSN